MSGHKVDVKVVLLGKEYGGKTSLVERYLHNRFCGDLPYQNTIGAAYGAKRIEVFGRSIVMGIWDTAGSERYQAMSRIYYRDAWAAILCIDLTDSSSFEKAKFWVKELQMNEPSCRLYFAGTKKDAVDSKFGKPEIRQIDFYSLLEFSEQFSNASVFETSSRTGEQVNELFERIAKDFVKDSQHRVAKCSKENEDQFQLEENFRSGKRFPKCSKC